MRFDLVLASGSEIRAQMLRQAGLTITVEPARVDEDAMRAALQEEGAPPRDVADTLAEAKARKAGPRNPDALTLGCDQVLAFDGQILSKPASREAAADQIRALSGQTHRLFSAAVLYQGSEPVWRHVGAAKLTMRPVSEAYLSDYLDRCWPAVASSVGGYQIEAEGVRLFAAIEGDYHSILGLPLTALLNFLAQRGSIPA